MERRSLDHKVSSKQRTKDETRKKDSRLDRDHGLKKSSLSGTKELSNDAKQRSSSSSRKPQVQNEEPRMKSKSVERHKTSRYNHTQPTTDFSPNAVKVKNHYVAKPQNDAKSKSSKNKLDSSKRQADGSSYRSKNHERSSRDAKTNAQIAKSFVKNAESNSKHSNNQHKSEVHSNKSRSESSERPKTSTIRKGPLNSTSVIPQNSQNKEKNLLSEQNSKDKLNADSEDEVENEYEEDFENYDSDFEESDAASVSDSEYTGSSNEEQGDERRNELAVSGKALVPALIDSSFEDNQHVKQMGEKSFLKMSDRSSLSIKSVSPEPLERKQVKLSRSFIDFATAVEQEETLAKHMKDDELHDSDFHILPLESMSQNIFQNLGKNFVHSEKLNCSQAFVQTEVLEDEETQTDELQNSNKWTQYPMNGTIGYGGDSKKEEDNSSIIQSLFSSYSTKFSSFLQKSSAIILAILEEEAIPMQNRKLQMQRRQNFFQSSGYHVIPNLNFLRDMRVVNICSCCNNKPYIITIHDGLTQFQTTENIDQDKGVMCIWNIMNIKKPEYILVSNSQPTCVTFAPTSIDMIVAGMIDGAVMLWDLTDIQMNILATKDSEVLSLWTPTYNTAHILSSDGHDGSVVGIQTVNSYTEENYSFQKIDSSKCFHVLSLEDMGAIMVWVVVQTLKPDISGLETDLGLAPGGRYRLVRSSCIQLNEFPILQMHQKSCIRSFDFKIVPFDPSRILVTTDVGVVLHLSRHGSNVEPRFYFSKNDLYTEVHCIQFSPHVQDLFLVGCSNGSIKLFNINFVHPLKEFLHTNQNEPVDLVQWSPIHPSVFFVLSGSSWLYVWSVSDDNLQPVQSYHFEDTKITWFAFKSMEEKAAHKAVKKIFNLLVAKENGEIEVHVLEEGNSDEYKKEIEILKNL